MINLTVWFFKEGGKLNFKSEFVGLDIECFDTSAIFRYIKQNIRSIEENETVMFEATDTVNNLYNCRVV